MNDWLSRMPFRLGTTSYIIPDDILPNARFLAGQVRDIELVLFEVDDGPSNLPSVEVIAELIAIAKTHDLTYTVHLPLDLRLGAEGEAQHASLVKARRVIDAAAALEPWAYVLHLDGKEYQSLPHGKAFQPDAELQRWQDQAVRALELVSQWAEGPEQLAVENLEGYPLDFLEPVLARVPVSRCVDVGHLWNDGHDPLAYLEMTSERTRVIHWHGIGTRDHQSLAHMPLDQVGSVLNWLMSKPYPGVVTVEVFGQEDFESSMGALVRCLEDGLGGSSWARD
jgi:sugar phosphate isomerase/epimerase